jgi:hypothetical protein
MEVRLKSAILAVALSALAAAAQPMSGVYPVGPGGSGVDSFATVQAAAGALSARGLAGDVEFPIRQFVYTGPVTVSNVAGSGQFRTWFHPTGVGAIVDAGGAMHAFAVESTDNVTVEGLRFRGCRDSGSAFVRFTASDHGILRSCRLEDSAQFGVQVIRSDSFLAESLRCEGELLGPGSRALDFQDCRFAFATRCSILGWVGSGLWIQGGSDNGSYRVSAKRTLGHGLHIENSPRAMIHNFRAYGRPEYSGYLVNARLARLDSCVFADGTRGAAYFESCESLWFNMAMGIGDAERAVSVINSNFSRVMALSVMGSPGRGLYLRGSCESHIDSTQYAGFTADSCIAVEVDSSECTMFMYTQVTGRVKRGISIRRSCDVKFAHTRMTLTDAEAGIYLEQADRVRFEPCSLNLTRAGVGVLVADSSSADSFLRMTIVGTCGTGVLARGAREPVLANSFVTGWAEDGIRLEGGRSAALHYNSVVGPTSGPGAAVYLQGATDVRASDNILANRGGDSSACWRIRGDWPLRVGGSDYNDLYVAGAGSTARVNDTLYQTLAAWQGLPGAPDPASIAANPAFVSDSDCHIAATSPCRDAGVPVTGFTYDIDADERDSVSPDIGADEFRVPGVAERPVTTGAWPGSGPGIVRSVLFLPAAVGEGRLAGCVVLLDISGRPVAELKSGPNDLRQFPSGVYFVRTAEAGTPAARVRKVVVLR